ncbi:hypothetical protein BH10PLA1_BH10PLA1_09650 [soil metagenome]
MSKKKDTDAAVMDFLERLSALSQTNTQAIGELTKIVKSLAKRVKTLERKAKKKK